MSQTPDRGGRTDLSQRSRAPWPWWAGWCFLLSGAAGLIYEVAWSKQISYLLGSSLHSVATVAAAFLGGLALGARYLGPPLVRSGEPLRRYALLELGVGGLGVAILPLLRALDGPVGHIYRATGGEGAPFAVARVVLLFVVLVPPAALMGATLPVLVARVERGRVGIGLAALYAINTCGAVAGSLLAGFVLMPQLGLTGTTVVAGGLNAVAAVVAWWSGRGGAAGAAAAVPRERPPALLPPPARAMLGVAFALSGFAAMALQLAWFRLYGLVLGSSVYSFAAVLGVYLLGIALGSALIARGLERMARPAGFAFLQFAVVITTLLGLHAAPALPQAMLTLGERAGASWSGLFVAQLGLVVPVVLVPCALLGALFPLTTRLLQDGDGSAATGHAYALNTLGTIAGTLTTGFLLLPWLGVQGVVLVATALSGSAGLAALLLPGVRRPSARVWAVVGLLMVAGGASAVSLKPWDPVLMSLGTYRPFHAQNLLAAFQSAGGTGDPTRQVAAAQRVLYYREGINASVLVATDLEGKRRWMRVGGKIDASTGDMTTQVLLGLLPAVLADSGARTLIVGHGSGYTAAAALAGGAGRTDIVELEAAVVAGSRLFHEPGHDPLDDARVRLHVEDARTRLAHGGERYGLIISEPTNPWIAGVNNLFTVEFYRRVRARLEPEGVFCQWLQLYELSPATFHSLLASFMEVFPESQMFCVWRSSDLIMLAVPPGRRLSRARLASAGAQRSLTEARLSSADELAAMYVGPAAMLRAGMRGVPLDTDDRPTVEYRAPRDLIEVSRRQAGHSPEVMTELSRPVLPPALGLLEEWPRAIILAVRARSRLEGTDSLGAAAVFAELRAAGADGIAASLTAEYTTSQVAVRNRALLERSRALAASGDAAGARAALEALAAADAAPPAAWLALAQARWEGGEFAPAGSAARRALLGLTGAKRLEPLLVAGMSAFHDGRSSEALGYFREARTVVPTDARGYDYEARVRVTTGDRAGARAVVEQGLVRLPGNPVLLQAQRALTLARRAR